MSGNDLDRREFVRVMMALSVGIGALHVAYACVRDGLRHPRWPERLAPFGWAAAVLGGFALWGGSQAGLDALTRAGTAALCGGLALVVLFAGSGERPLKRVGLGIAALTSVTGAFGDVLSYMRLFALGLASWQVLVALLIGIVIVNIFCNLVAKPSQATGVPYPVICRSVFGVLGANIPAIIRGLIAVAWYGIQTYLASAALDVVHASKLVQRLWLYR